MLVLFCAAVAPELVGRDQRNRMLSLYFSRALSRFDYALARFAALTSVMLVLTLGPQVLLYVGNGMAADDLSGYVTDRWDLDLPDPRWLDPLSAIVASVGLVIAAYIPRRAYATAVIVGFFVLSYTVAAILMETVDPMYAQYALLTTPAVWDGIDLLALPGGRPGRRRRRGRELPRLGRTSSRAWSRSPSPWGSPIRRFQRIQA